jgi:hypothetical protein
MFTAIAPLLMLAQDAPPPVIASTRIARPSPNAQIAAIDDIGIRVASPEGILWQGVLRVGPNQGASYHQSLTQASPEQCPPGLSYDRSQRSHLNVNIYAQQNQTGRSYQVDVSWARPTGGEDCAALGTRTAQVNQAVAIEIGEMAIIEGDAGLQVQLTRRR